MGKNFDCYGFLLNQKLLAFLWQRQTRQVRNSMLIKMLSLAARGQSKFINWAISCGCHRKLLLLTFATKWKGRGGKERKPWVAHESSLCADDNHAFKGAILARTEQLWPTLGALDKQTWVRNIPGPNFICRQNMLALQRAKWDFGMAMPTLACISKQIHT